MRRPRTQGSDLLTLPMGCCCSKIAKVHPDTEKERTGLAPPPPQRIPQPLSSFSFGKPTPQLNLCPALQNSTCTSSLEDHLQPEDFHNYNRLVAQHRKPFRRKNFQNSKLPNPTGFLAPAFPAVHGQGPGPSYSSRAFKNKSGAQEGEVTQKGDDRRPNDHLHYKRLDHQGGNVSSDENNFATDSEPELIPEKAPPPKMLPGGRTLEKKIISIQRDNGNEEFYEQTYSKTSIPTNKRPMSRPPTSPKRPVTFAEKVKLGRKDVGLTKVALSKKEILAQKKARALEQRLLCAYLSQPKARILPIIRESVSKQQQQQVSSSGRKQQRRILKKPWLMTSQRNLAVMSATSKNNSLSLRMMEQQKPRQLPPSKSKVSRRSHEDENGLDSNDNRKKATNQPTTTTTPHIGGEEGEEDFDSLELGGSRERDGSRRIDPAAISSRANRRQAFTRNYIETLLIKDTYYN